MWKQTNMVYGMLMVLALSHVRCCPVHMCNTVGLGPSTGEHELNLTRGGCSPQ
jgi:hypothetical protein